MMESFFKLTSYGVEVELLLLLKNFKLTSYGVEVELLLLLKNYLENREQRVALNGQTSD